MLSDSTWVHFDAALSHVINFDAGEPKLLYHFAFHVVDALASEGVAVYHLWEVRGVEKLAVVVYEIAKGHIFVVFGTDRLVGDHVSIYFDVSAHKPEELLGGEL